MGWLQLPGWFSFPALYDEFIAGAPVGATIVEVGVAYGRSLMYLARRAIDAGRHDIRIVGVDPWGQEGARLEPSYEGRARLFCDVLTGMMTHTPDELERVSLWRCTSAEAAHALPGDLYAVFIDGDHTKEAVTADLLAWKEKSRVLAGHDIDIDDVQQAVREMIGPEGVGYRVWQDPNTGKGMQLEWEGDAGTMRQGQGPCWVRL